MHDGVPAATLLFPCVGGGCSFSCRYGRLPLPLPSPCGKADPLSESSRALHCGGPPGEPLVANYGFRIVADLARSDGVLILLIDESKTTANGNYRRLVAAAGLWGIQFRSASRDPTGVEINSFIKKTNFIDSKPNRIVRWQTGRSFVF